MVSDEKLNSYQICGPDTSQHRGVAGWLDGPRGEECDPTARFACRSRLGDVVVRGAGPDYNTHPKTWMMRSAQRPPGAGTKWS